MMERFSSCNSFSYVLAVESLLQFVLGCFHFLWALIKVFNFFDSLSLCISGVCSSLWRRLCWESCCTCWTNPSSPCWYLSKRCNCFPWSGMHCLVNCLHDGPSLPCWILLGIFTSCLVFLYFSLWLLHKKLLLWLWFYNEWMILRILKWRVLLLGLLEAITSLSVPVCV